MPQMFVGTQEKYSPNVNAVYLDMPKGDPTPSVPSTSGPLIQWDAMHLTKTVMTVFDDNC